VLGGTVERATITHQVSNLYVGAAEPYSRLLAEVGVAPVVLEQQIADTAVTLDA
jgi:hypothetical protein